MADDESCSMGKKKQREKMTSVCRRANFNRTNSREFFPLGFFPVFDVCM